MKKYIDYKSACLTELRTIMTDLRVESYTSLYNDHLSANAIGKAYAQHCIYRRLEWLLDHPIKAEITVVRDIINNLGNYSDAELKDKACLAVLKERIKWQDKILRVLDFLEIILNEDELDFAEKDYEER